MILPMFSTYFLSLVYWIFLPVCPWNSVTLFSMDGDMIWMYSFKAAVVCREWHIYAEVTHPVCLLLTSQVYIPVAPKPDSQISPPSSFSPDSPPISPVLAGLSVIFCLSLMDKLVVWGCVWWRVRRILGEWWLNTSKYGYFPYVLSALKIVLFLFYKDYLFTYF